MISCDCSRKDTEFAFVGSARSQLKTELGLQDEALCKKLKKNLWRRQWRRLCSLLLVGVRLPIVDRLSTGQSSLKFLSRW